MIGIDTNVLLRYVLHDDGVQSPRSVRLIDVECAPDDPALVTNIVLVETVWYIDQKLRRPKGEIVDLLWALLDNLHLTFEYPDAVEKAVQEYEKGPADFADYLLAMTCLERGANPVRTFDRDASKRPPFDLLLP